MNLYFNRIVTYNGFMLQESGRTRNTCQISLQTQIVTTNVNEDLDAGNYEQSYPMGRGDLFARVKRPTREDDHSPPSSADIKNTRSYIFTPAYVMSWCLIKNRIRLHVEVINKHRDNFTFTFQPS
jgi:hypothetical protein